MSALSRAQLDVSMINSAIVVLDDRARRIVDETAEKLRVLIEDAGDNGLIALALVGAEKALEAVRAEERGHG